MLIWIGLAFLIFTILISLSYGFITSNINKRKFLKRKKTKRKVIYLTFDDGPSKYTNELLDLLKKYDIKATFFCVANFAKDHEDIIRRMKNEGHLIALHSLKHKNAMLQGPLETKRDLETSLDIMNSFGIDIKYYRPPWGDSNLCLLRYLREKGISLILWDVMAEDWEAGSTKNMIQTKLLTRTKPGDIICLHDRKRKK